MRYPKPSRAERYAEKQEVANTIPVSVATVNFIHDSNLGFVIRSMACFGATDLHVIGAIPSHHELKRLSGSLDQFVKIYPYHTPSELMQYAREREFYVISAELDNRAIPIANMQVPKDKHILLVLGHETSGVPEEILHMSDSIVHIPMLSVGYCLNTSQAGNILLYELAKQLM